MNIWDRICIFLYITCWHNGTGSWNSASAKARDCIIKSYCPGTQGAKVSKCIMYTYDTYTMYTCHSLCNYYVLLDIADNAFQIHFKPNIKGVLRSTRHLTHSGPVTPYGNIELVQHWLGVIACCLRAPSHYLNHCWLIISKRIIIIISE